jgi:hypothetical protein
MPKQKKDNQFNYKNKDASEGQKLIVKIPSNFFENTNQIIYKDDIFGNKIKENRALEQYFWTKDIVQKNIERV